MPTESKIETSFSLIDYQFEMEELPTKSFYILPEEIENFEGGFESLESLVPSEGYGQLNPRGRKNGEQLPSSTVSDRPTSEDQSGQANSNKPGGLSDEGRRHVERELNLLASKNPFLRAAVQLLLHSRFGWPGRKRPTYGRPMSALHIESRCQKRKVTRTLSRRE